MGKDFNKDRTGFIGGSDIAGVMGLSRWTTPLSLWALKTKQIEDPFEMNEAVEFGIELEGFVSDKFAQRTGKTVTIDETEYVHPEYPYMRAHIDRRVDGKEVFEAKTCSAYKANEWDGDDIPDEYQLQLNWYLGLVGDTVGHIACLIGGQKFVYKEMKFNPELFALQVERAKDFWENFVIPVVAPMAIANDKDTLVELFPESRPDTLQSIREDEPALEATFNDLAIECIEGKSQKKEIEVVVDDAENKIRQLIGVGEGLETGQYKATWKNQQSMKVDTEKLKEDGLYEKYAVRKQIRVLRVIEKKGKK